LIKKMDTADEIFRKVPQVEKLLQSEGVRDYTPVLGRDVVVGIIRDETRHFRDLLKKNADTPVESLTDAIVQRCRAKKLEKLQRVINGTGIIIHTNLGRSPLAEDILENLKQIAGGYCNLELYLPLKKRGRRGGFAEELLCLLTSAEDALIVNNNAASVFLILREFGAGREVVVSRGELVQIGGGFRIPDIMNQTGACLVEVGTTNITTVEDYRRALTERTAMVFSAHRSNFRMEGFTASPELKELAALKEESLLFVRDLGSGNLVRDGRLPRDFEPTAGYELSQGADLVCFSGDKLLGACQAGIIVGRKDLIARLRKNPLMRMLRVDKISYYLLQETLLCYADGRVDSIKLWDMILQDSAAIRKRINRLLRRVHTPEKKSRFSPVPLKSTYGGGAMPAREIDSAGLRVRVPGYSADEIHTALAHGDVPIIGYVEDDDYFLNFMTVLDRDVNDLAAALNRLADNAPGGF